MFHLVRIKNSFSFFYFDHISLWVISDASGRVIYLKNYGEIPEIIIESPSAVVDRWAF
jgi:hypothetical protein